jgi:hypothetical protein
MAWLCLASLTGYALEPVFSLSVVNRWDAVVFEVQRDFTPSLAMLPWTATEFSLDWQSLAKEAPAWTGPELRAAQDSLPPLEWPKGTVPREKYVALSDALVSVGPSNRAFRRKRDKPNDGFEKLRFVRARLVRAVA